MALTSFSRLVTQLAETDPHRTAVTCGGQITTRRQLDSNTNRNQRTTE